MELDAAFKERQQWTRMLVRNAIVYAYRVDRYRGGQSIGPRGDAAFWMDMAEEPDVDPDRFEPTRRDITWSEYVLVGFRAKDGSQRSAWLNGPIMGYTRQRSSLERYAVWAARGKVDRDGCSQTDEDFANDILHVSHVAMWNRLNFACEMIAGWLNEAELAPWIVEKPKRRENRMVAASA
jgi:hypothetical protein